MQDVPFRAKRIKRTPGGDAYVDNKQHFREFINRLISNDPTLGTLNGRLLRLKDYVSPDASTAQLDMVIECLKQNVRVEVLYIQNFEKVTVSSFCMNVNATVVSYVLANMWSQHATPKQYPSWPVLFCALATAVWPREHTILWKL